MSAPSFFDLEALLQPISTEQPCGPDMLLSAEFDAIQAARQQEDMSLDQGEWVTERKEANLPFVMQCCTQLLREKTKDLRLAIWLTDALASQHGLEGLSQGYRLLDALTESYWDSVHPGPEDGDLSSRIGNLSWLLKRTIEQLENAPLLHVGASSISMLTWQSAVALEQAVRRNPSEVNNLVRGKTTMEELERLRAQVPSKQLQTLYFQLAQYKVSFDAFANTLYAKLGDEAPSFSAVRESLDRLQHQARLWGAKDLAADIPPPAKQIFDQAQITTATPAKLNPSMPTNSAGPIHTRADAIALLQQAAAFFERTEPSSPAAYMAQKAARWAQLPLHEWLKHVIKSNDELALLEEMLGVTNNARVAREQ